MRGERKGWVGLRAPEGRLGGEQPLHSLCTQRAVCVLSPACACQVLMAPKNAVGKQYAKILRMNCVSEQGRGRGTG